MENNTVSNGGGCKNEKLVLYPVCDLELATQKAYSSCAQSAGRRQSMSGTMSPLHSLENIYRPVEYLYA
jgi:hypothetical protein